MNTTNLVFRRPFHTLLIVLLAAIVIIAFWRGPHLRARIDPSALNVPQGRKNEVPQVPDGWKRIEIKDQVSLVIPSAMTVIEPLGDSFRRRQAYADQTLSITIASDSIVRLRDSEKPALYSCASRSKRESSSYHESTIEIDARQAKLSIDRSPTTIVADLCFPNLADGVVPLRIIAVCKDDRALETAQTIFASISFNKKPRTP